MNEMNGEISMGREKERIQNVNPVSSNEIRSNLSTKDDNKEKSSAK